MMTTVDELMYGRRRGGNVFFECRIVGGWRWWRCIRADINVRRRAVIVVNVAVVNVVFDFIIDIIVVVVVLDFVIIMMPVIVVVVNSWTWMAPFDGLAAIGDSIPAPLVRFHNFCNGKFQGGSGRFVLLHRRLWWFGCDALGRFHGGTFGGHGNAGWTARLHTTRTLCETIEMKRVRIKLTSNIFKTIKFYITTQFLIGPKICI